MADIDVWDIYNELSGVDRSSMNEAKRGLLAVCDLRQEVNSGGLDSYFRYRGGNSAPDAVRVLPTLLEPAWADLLTEAMRLLGPQYPIDAATRENLLDKGELDDQLADLDYRYSALEAGMDADAKLNAYVARTPDVTA